MVKETVLFLFTVVIFLSSASAFAQNMIVYSQVILETVNWAREEFEAVPAGGDVVFSVAVESGISFADTALIARVSPSAVVWSQPNLFDTTVFEPTGEGFLGDVVPGEIALAQGGEVVGALNPSLWKKEVGSTGLLRVFRLNSNGLVKWTTDLPGDEWYSMSSTDSRLEYHPQVAVLPDDSVVVASTFGLDQNGPQSGRVARIDSKGDVAWITEVVLPGFDFIVQDVAVAPDGSIRVAGPQYGVAPISPGFWSRRPGGNDFLYMASIRPAGTLDWINSIRGQIGNIFTEIHPTDVHVDSNGDAVLIGSTETAFGVYATNVARFDDEGTLLWSDEIPDNPDGQAQPQDTHMRPDGSVVVAFESFTDVNRVGVASWAPNGTREWIIGLPNPEGMKITDINESIALDAAGNLLLSGLRCSLSTCADFQFASVDRTGSTVTLLKNPSGVGGLLVGHGPGQFSAVSCFGKQCRVLSLRDTNLVPEPTNLVILPGLSVLLLLLRRHR